MKDKIFALAYVLTAIAAFWAVPQFDSAQSLMMLIAIGYYSLVMFVAYVGNFQNIKDTSRHILSFSVIAALFATFLRTPDAAQTDMLVITAVVYIANVRA